jgi:Asp-tRNA(Asn)/Glu-tRNA(Gln) amidotransferase A subunit family amidase
LKGEAGLPLGVQVVGAFNTDAETLRAAGWVGRAIVSGSA